MQQPQTMNRASKLTAERVLEARAKARMGESVAPLARRWGVAVETLRRAVRGETWGWLGDGVTAGQVAELDDRLAEAAQASQKKLLEELGKGA